MSDTVDMKKEFEHIEKVRVDASIDVRSKRQKLDEQYFTPKFVTNYIAEHLVHVPRESHFILDVAAGVGNIGAAVALALLHKKGANAKIDLKAVEIDTDLCDKCKVLFNTIFSRELISYEIIESDFFDFFKRVILENSKYTTIVMNPPYAKLLRKDFSLSGLDKYGIEYSPNLYSLMMSCSLDLLHDEGELIAIVPRSFCSGPLFLNFRKKINREFRISFIHLFESRTKVFSFDGVQQETIIIKLHKKNNDNCKTTVSYGDDFEQAHVTLVEHNKIIFPGDINCIIHVPHNAEDEVLLNKMHSFGDSLESLGLKVSTGKVVDFRTKEFLSQEPQNNGWLFCKENLESDMFTFSKKDFRNFIMINSSTIGKFLDEQCHVIINRIFFKERKKAIVAHVIDLTNPLSKKIAVENHLNYISGTGDTKLEYYFALGVKYYLESDLVSDYIRRFIGSTQINAADIKSLPFPSRQQLTDIGKKGEFKYDE